MSFGLNRTLNKLLGGGTETQNQVPLETPEQAAARKKLMEFADTGKFGDFTAGANIGIQPGDFNATDIEKLGLSNLQALLQSGIPSQYKMADEAMADLMATDPAKIQAQFDPFKAQTERQIAESNAALKRGAGFAGNLYSTRTIQNLGDIQARGNETLTSKLAELTNQALDRRVSAAQVAIQSAQAQEEMNLNRISASQTYGSLIRNLNNQAVDARNAEILRRRNELMLPINAAGTVVGSNVQFGVPSIETPKQSTVMDLLNIAAKVGGQVVGNRMGSGTIGGGNATYAA